MFLHSTVKYLNCVLKQMRQDEERDLGATSRTAGDSVESVFWSKYDQRDDLHSTPKHHSKIFGVIQYRSCEHSERASHK